MPPTRSSFVSARIISRIAWIRSPSKNMCSVRQRPIPSAPNSRARCGVGRRVGIRANLERAIFVGPFHHRGEIARELRLLPGDFADHHFAGRAVDRENVFVRERAAADGDLAGLFVDVQLPGPGHAAAAPAAGDDRRMARHAAGAGENAGRQMHPFDVFGVGFLADQQHALRRHCVRSTASGL